MNRETFPFKVSPYKTAVREITEYIRLFFELFYNHNFPPLLTFIRFHGKLIDASFDTGVNF